jgi:hypothetical protein
MESENLHYFIQIIKMKLHNNSTMSVSPFGLSEVKMYYRFHNT